MYAKYEKTEMSPINLIMINGPNKNIELPPIQKVMSCFERAKSLVHCQIHNVLNLVL
jgi:hypothetical protein